LNINEVFLHSFHAILKLRTMYVSSKWEVCLGVALALFRSAGVNTEEKRLDQVRLLISNLLNFLK
jgi:hypothetical protein